MSSWSAPVRRPEDDARGSSRSAGPPSAARTGSVRTATMMPMPEAMRGQGTGTVGRRLGGRDRHRPGLGHREMLAGDASSVVHARLAGHSLSAGPGKAEGSIPADPSGRGTAGLCEDVRPDAAVRPAASSPRPGIRGRRGELTGGEASPSRQVRADSSFRPVAERGRRAPGSAQCPACARVDGASRRRPWAARWSSRRRSRAPSSRPRRPRPAATSRRRRPATAARTRPPRRWWTASSRMRARAWWSPPAASTRPP